MDRFLGEWRLERMITDHLADLLGRFEGVARFKAGQEFVACVEDGFLTYGKAARLPATRTYLWRQAGQKIQVHFSDGKFFHEFDARCTTPESSHFCQPDQYDVRYDFSNPERWTSIWQVLGPRKNYRMISTYFRSAA